MFWLTGWLLASIFNMLDKKRKEEKLVFSTDTVNKVDMTAERKHLYAPRRCGKWPLPSLETQKEKLIIFCVKQI